MESHQQPAEELPHLESSSTDAEANLVVSGKTASGSTQPQFSAELVAAIRETIARQNDQQANNDMLQESLRAVAGRHPGAEITDPVVAADVVRALATAEFPAPQFRAAIDRFSTNIAGLLLADPVCSDQLILLWNSLTEHPE